MCIRSCSARMDARSGKIFHFIVIVTVTTMSHYIVSDSSIFSVLATTVANSLLAPLITMTTSRPDNMYSLDDSPRPHLLASCKCGINANIGHHGHSLTPVGPPPVPHNHSSRSRFIRYRSRVVPLI